MRLPGYDVPRPRAGWPGADRWQSNEVAPRPALSPSDCHVWWADPTAAASRWPHLLDPGERTRLAAYRQPADRDRFVAGRALLRLVAARYLGAVPESVHVTADCPDCSLPHGKPMIVGSDLEVSISHAGRRVAVAITRAGTVGVDVEEIDPDLRVADLLVHVLTAPERAYPSADGAKGFYRMWTRKEAALKATGDGLRVPLSGIEVSAPDDEPVILRFERDAPRADQFVIADLDAGAGYLASIAVISAGPVRFTAFSGW